MAFETAESDARAVSALLVADIHRQQVSSSPWLLPAASGSAAILWWSIGGSGVAIWAVVAHLSILACIVILRRSVGGELEDRRRAVIWTNVLSSVGFASVAAIAMPEQSESQAFLGTVLLVILAVNLGDSSGDRTVFLAFHGPATLLIAGSFGVLADGTARYVAPITLVLGGVLWVFADGIRATLAERAQLTIQNDRLVGELTEANGRLRLLARRDSLTGLANRRHFDEFLADAFESSTLECPVAVICLDLDDFKLVNDELGHQAGDDLLVAVARRLQGRCPEGALLARLGGDELAVCVPVVTGDAEAERILGRLMTAFDEPFSIGASRRRVGASGGTAVASSGRAGDPASVADATAIASRPALGLSEACGEATPRGLLREADAALYVSKRAGKTARPFPAEVEPSEA